MGWGKYIITRVVAPIAAVIALGGCMKSTQPKYPITQEEFLESVKTTKIIPYFHRLSETERLLAKEIAFNRREALGNTSGVGTLGSIAEKNRKAIDQEVTYRKQDEKERWGTIIPLSDALKELEPAQKKLIDGLSGIEKVFAAYKTEQERQRKADDKAMADYKTGKAEKDKKLGDRVTANEGGIATNKGETVTNKALYTGLAGRVTANEGGIATNKAGVAGNKTSINTITEDYNAEFKEKLDAGLKALADFKKEYDKKVVDLTTKQTEFETILRKMKDKGATDAELEATFLKYQQELNKFRNDYSAKLKTLSDKAAELERMIEEPPIELSKMKVGYIGLSYTDNPNPVVEIIPADQLPTREELEEEVPPPSVPKEVPEAKEVAPVPQ